MSSISLSLSTSVTIESLISDVIVEVCHIKKEDRTVKIHLFDSADKIDVIYRDSEKIILKVDTKPETIYFVSRDYIAELRDEVVTIFLLENSKLDIEKLKIDIDVEYEERDDDYDTYFYLKLQTE